MCKRIKAYLNKPAFWYEFWLPQSGGAGGLINLSIIAILIFTWNIL